MNRPIEFRVWNPDDKRMEYPLVIAISVDKIMKPLITCADGNRAYKDFPLMQFTGLLDKNGKRFLNMISAKKTDILKYMKLYSIKVLGLLKQK